MKKVARKIVPRATGGVEFSPRWVGGAANARSRICVSTAKDNTKKFEKMVPLRQVTEISSQVK